MFQLHTKYLAYLAETEDPLLDSSHEQQFLSPSTTALQDVLESLLQTLKNGSEEEFLEQYNSCLMRELSNENQISLLAEVIVNSKDKIKAFNAILSNVTDINIFVKVPNDFDKSVVELAFENMNSEALRKLLYRSDVKFHTKIVERVKAMFFSEIDDKQFWICFELLHRKFDIAGGKQGCLLLEEALAFEQKSPIQKLLRKGTYIGWKYKETKLFIIDDIDSQYLTELFDACITKFKDHVEVYEFDFQNLKPVINDEDSENDNLKEMTPIMRIACSKEKQHLLKHPYIKTFMTIKWGRISKFFYANVILYCLYIISIVTYIILNCEGFGSDHPMVKLAFGFSVFGITYLIIREITQFWPPKKYLSKPINYLEIFLIIVSIVTITMDFQKDKKEFVVLTILLIVVDFCFLLRSLPFPIISSHMLMLEEILKTFIESFSLYSIFLVAFSLCFYVLIRGGADIKDENNINGTDGKDESNSYYEEDEPNNELDLGNLGLRNANSDVLYLLFVVSMNLLNGLAVNDIQIIRERADLNALIYRAKVLNTFEDYYFPLFKKLRKDYALLVFCISCDCSTKVHLVTNPARSSYHFNTKYCGRCKESITKMNTMFSKMLSRTYFAEMGSKTMTNFKQEAKNIFAKKTHKTDLQILEKNIKNQLRNIEEQNKIIEKKMQIIEENILKILS